MPPCAAFDQVCIGILGGGLWSIWVLFTAFLVGAASASCRHKRRETARPRGPAPRTLHSLQWRAGLFSLSPLARAAHLQAQWMMRGCIGRRPVAAAATLGAPVYSRIKIKAHEVCAWRVVAVARGGRLSPLAHPAALLQRACRHTPSMPAERHMCPAAGQPHMHQDKCFNFKKKGPLLARID